MERNRESRRATSSVSNNFPSSRRRPRSSVFRDSSGACEVEEGGGNDLVRDRLGAVGSNKKERERPIRRRRLSSNDSYHVDRDEVEDESSDESVDEENDDEDEPVRGGSTSTSLLRRTCRGKPQWKASDEVISLSVPRKARSAPAKRLHDSISVAAQQSSCSPARPSAASVSPSSSNASMKANKKVKLVTTKARPPKTSKVTISESEVEVAQFLYGLTRLQSHSSPAKTEVDQNYSQKVDQKQNSSNDGSVSVASKANSPMSPPSFSQPMALPQHSSSTYVPAVTAPKRKRPRAVPFEVSGSLVGMTACSSKPSVNTLSGNSVTPESSNPIIKVEAEIEPNDAKSEIISPKSDNNVETIDHGPSMDETSLLNSSPLQTSKPKVVIKPEEMPSSSSHAEMKPLVSTEMGSHSTTTPDIEEKKDMDTNSQSSLDQNRQTTLKDLSSSVQDLLSISTADVKLESSKMRSSTVSAKTEGSKGTKIEIDLMALPEYCYPDDCMASQIDGSAILASEHEPIQATDGNDIKCKGVVDPSEKYPEKVNVNQDCSVLGSEKIPSKEAKLAVDLEKQSTNKKTEPVNDENSMDKAVNKHQSQKIPKSTSRQMDLTVPPLGIMTSTSAPITLPMSGWPGGIPPYGCLGSSPSNLSGLPSLQGAKPVEGNSSIANVPFFMLPHPRPKRCATHLFIAHLISYQQQFARLNPFWHVAGSSASLYGARPYNMNILPPSDAMLLGSSVLRNTNLPANSSLGPSNSSVKLNSQNSKERAAPNSFTDSQMKQHMPPPVAPQGAAFLFPFSQPRAGETKSNSVVDAGILPLPSAATATAAPASASAKFSNVTGAPDPQYLTMLPGNFAFPIPPSYRAHMSPQQQTGAPFFGGSFYPSQLMQLPQTQIPTSSSGALSSQKHLQSQQCLPTSKSMPESDSARKNDSSSDNRLPPSQKKVQTDNCSGNPLQVNLRPNFPIMAPAGGGKQQPPSDPSLQISLKATEVPRSVPPNHAMLQAMSDVGHNHFHLGHHLQFQMSTQSKAPMKAASKGSDKSPESVHSLSTAAATQQLQKQPVTAQTKQSTSASSQAVTSGGVAYMDRIPMVYSGAGSNLQAGPMSFPAMQSHPQWKMPLSQRAVQPGPSGNAIVNTSVPAAVTTQSTGSPSSNKVTKLPSSPLNSTSRKPIHSGSPVSAQSSQVQTNPGKIQPLFGTSNSELMHQASSNAMPHKWHGEANFAAQPMFPGGLNMRRPTSQQTQQGSPVMTVAGANGYISGGGKAPAVYNHPLGGGNSVTVMAGASYVKSAANLPVKSAEQKPATA